VVTAKGNLDSQVAQEKDDDVNNSLSKMVSAYNLESSKLTASQAEVDLGHPGRAGPQRRQSCRGRALADASYANAMWVATRPPSCKPIRRFQCHQERDLALTIWTKWR